MCSKALPILLCLTGVVAFLLGCAASEKGMTAPKEAPGCLDPEVLKTLQARLSRQGLEAVPTFDPLAYKDTWSPETQTRTCRVMFKYQPPIELGQRDIQTWAILKEQLDRQKFPVDYRISWLDQSSGKFEVQLGTEPPVTQFAPPTPMSPGLSAGASPSTHQSAPASKPDKPAPTAESINVPTSSPTIRSPISSPTPQPATIGFEPTVIRTSSWTYSIQNAEFIGRLALPATSPSYSSNRRYWPPKEADGEWLAIWVEVGLRGMQPDTITPEDFEVRDSLGTIFPISPVLLDGGSSGVGGPGGGGRREGPFSFNKPITPGNWAPTILLADIKPGASGLKLWFNRVQEYVDLQNPMSRKNTLFLHPNGSGFANPMGLESAIAPIRTERRYTAVVCRMPSVEERRQPSSWAQLVSSDEGQAVIVVRSLYEEVLGRDPVPNDCAGLRYFVDQRTTPDKIRETLVRSDEYKSKGHPKEPPNPMAAVTRYYELINERDFTEAYHLLSSQARGATSYESWVKSLRGRHGVVIEARDPTPQVTNVQKEEKAWEAVRILTTSIEDGQKKSQRFSVVWTLVPDTDGWRLNREYLVQELPYP